MYLGEANRDTLCPGRTWQLWNGPSHQSLVESVAVRPPSLTENTLNSFNWLSHATHCKNIAFHLLIFCQKHSFCHWLFVIIKINIKIVRADHSHNMWNGVICRVAITIRFSIQPTQLPLLPALWLPCWIRHSCHLHLRSSLFRCVSAIDNMVLTFEITFLLIPQRKFILLPF